MNFQIQRNPELIKMGNPEPNPIFQKQTKAQKVKKKKVQRLNGSCSNKWESVCVVIPSRPFHVSLNTPS